MSRSVTCKAIDTDLRLSDCSIIRIAVDEEQYEFDGETRYVKTIYFTDSDYETIEVYFAYKRSDEERISLDEVLQFFIRKVEDCQDMDIEEFESEIESYFGVDECELA